MSPRRPRTPLSGARRRAGGVVAAVIVVTAMAVTAAWGAFSGTTANSGNTITAANDLVPPTVSPINAGSTTSGRTGHLYPGGSYQVYGSASDTSGIGSVTADASAISTGQSAAAMTAGSYSYGGTTYGYRSGTLTANATIGSCTAAYTVNATDGAGTTGSASGSAMVDRDLLSNANITLTGETTGGNTGMAMSPAGDVNGDGRQDYMVGANTAVTLERNNNGVAFVVFGQASPTTVDLGNLGSGGFRIDGPASGTETGSALAPAGDVNADGKGDVLIGARATSTGNAYVVFGKATTTSVDLANLGSGGYAINAQAGGDGLGSAVANAGDVSGDGVPDQLVGAWFTDNNTRTNSGSAYVVFGKSSTTTVTLASLGSGGYRIDGAAADERAGWSVAALGDVNGDAIPDVAVGSYLADANGRTDSGSAYIVFGKRSDTNPIDLATLGAGGRRIDGAAASDDTAYSMAGGRDVNGDGTNDLAIGAIWTDNNSRGNSGSVYVVFGSNSTTTLDLASLGGSGYRIDGATGANEVGRSVALSADMNADGKAEVVTGAFLSDNNGRNDSGVGWVAYGKATTAALDLNALGTGGFRVDGATAGDEMGAAVTAIPDANGDGVPDVIFGAKWQTFGDRVNVGAAILVYGKTTNTTVDAASLGSSGITIKGGGNPVFAGPVSYTANQYWLAQVPMAAVGDLNGDGRGDIVVGQPYNESNKRTNNGAATVIFGQASPTTVDLNNPGANGYMIWGLNNSDGRYFGYAVAGAGDINADGKGDMLISGPSMDSNGRSLNGVVYVIFGKSTTSSITLNSLGTGGYLIGGAANFDSAGAAVANAGDVNGDTIPDQLVGAPQTDPGAVNSAGSAYVVFGKNDTNNVDLGALGSGGYRIDGAAANDNTGAVVANAGDVNGDGKTDALVAAVNTDFNSRSNSGSVFVVFGKTSDTNTIALGSLGAAGYRIDGKGAGDQIGYSLAGAGDLNADGKADQLVGTILADNNSRNDSGSVYVMFGKSSDTNTIDLNSIGTNGYRIDGAGAGEYAGMAVANAGDINGDGKPDQLLAARKASSNGRTSNGAAYLIDGKATTTNIDLGSIGTQGWAFDGAADGDEAVGVAMLGDLNGDGRTEFAIGSPRRDSTSTDSGAVSILNGLTCS
jgi:hypothetical protein